MESIFSGLQKLGLGDLGENDLYAEEEKAKEQKSSASAHVLPPEKDLIFEKKLPCPVCNRTFTSRVMKSSKSRLISIDLDLRTRYEGIDAIKYDVILCPHCGYASLGRYFNRVAPSQARAIQEQISGKVKLNQYPEEYYTYEEAIERYQVTLACAMVKRAKSSEKAYICLKMAWVLRGYQEELENKHQLLPKQREQLSMQEKEYLQYALRGFVNAQQAEEYPMCGMNEYTVDYLCAALAYETDQLDIASTYISRVLVSAANSRIKGRARELKELILEKRKENR